MKRLFDQPPCSQLKVKSSGPRLLELEGPVLAQRVAGGVTAAFGAGFAAVALSFLKAPFPGPFKLIPLAMGAAGAGISALGVFNATSEQSVRVDAGRSVTFRWRPGLLEPRERVVKAADIAALEVVHQVERHGSHDGGQDFSTDVYRLSLVTREGQDVPVELFATRTQANLRKEQIETLLAAAPGPEPRAAKAKRPARARKPKLA
jgi:hypothetical protein